jgi:hypothetical protein
VAVFSLEVAAQNLESIGKDDPFKVSGGLSLNQIGYFSNGIDSRRDPYSMYASGSLNFSFFGWSVPLSFAYSNQNFSYQQPFNQYALHPTYKWITAHVGYSSMNFSPYTLSGHIFRGIGIEATPHEKLRISAMHGRLQRAVSPDSLSSQNQSAFKRMGYGLKTTYGDSRQFIEFSLFRAKDDTTSIAYIPEDEGILPQENLVISLGGAFTLLKKIQWKGEWANSAITRDGRATASDRSGFFGSVGQLFTPRISTAYYQAYKTSVAYLGEGYSVGLGYERIDPEYRTLGAYFFNSDLENITVNSNVAMMQGKVNFSANVGTQRDNLDKSKISTMRRWVGALNVGFVPSEKINVSLGYSNFQTYTNIRSQFVDINQLTPYDNLDTLNFTQITQNANLNLAYLLPSTESRRQSINTNLIIMKAGDNQGGLDQDTGSIFYNLNTSYSLNFVPKNLTISASFNASQSETMGMNASTLGPTLALSKSLLDKKLRVSSSASLNNTYSGGNMTNTVLSIRANSGYSIKQKHNFNLGLVMLSRSSNRESGPQDFREFTGTLGYSYSF